MAMEGQQLDRFPLLGEKKKKKLMKIAENVDVESHNYARHLCTSCPAFPMTCFNGLNAVSGTSFLILIAFFFFQIMFWLNYMCVSLYIIYVICMQLQ